jgi:hypothetical protein
MYLVSDLDAYNLANAYAEFWNTLAWYRMYCVANFGENKADYKKGLDSLKNDFLELSEYDDVSKYIKEPATLLIESIESRLERKRFTDEDVKYIADLLWGFEGQKEDFTHKYLEAYLRQSAISNLPNGMASVLQLLEREEDNSAIAESFRYLDWLLQKLLNVSPHDYYGESLVNLAFAPGDGKIRLGTHENEQRGLRNFVSGAYALFRNPSAHRNIFDRTSGIIRFDSTEQSAATVTVMVSLLANLIYQTVFSSLDGPIRGELTRIAHKYGWNPDVFQYAWKFKYRWSVGALPKSMGYQLTILLTEDNQGPHLQIVIHTEFKKEDEEELLQNVRRISNLRTILGKR